MIVKVIVDTERAFGNGGNGEAWRTLEIAISASLVSLAERALSISHEAKDPFAFRVKFRWISPSL